MRRRYASLIGLVCVWTIFGAVSFADAPQERVIGTLAEQGFQVDEVGRTLLGRIIIKASSGSHVREVVIDRTTGEVLRDYWIEKSKLEDKKQKRNPLEADDDPPDQSPPQKARAEPPAPSSSPASSTPTTPTPTPKTE